MTSIEYAHRTQVRRSKAGTGLGAAAIALLLAGCSAEISQSDFPGFGLADNGGPTGSIPRPSEPMRGARSGLTGNGAVPQSYDTAYALPPSNDRPENARPEPTRFAALADASPPRAPATSITQAPPADQYAPAPYNSYNTARDVPPRANPEPVRAEGGSIIVKPGDTLYSLSKRHGVSLNDLIATNNLSGTSLKPGQTLKLPSGSPAPGSVARAAPAAAPAPVVDSALASSWHGTHDVKAGESLYQIARQHNVKTTDLQAANGISDPRKVRPGTVLKVPGAGSATAEAAPATQPQAPATPMSTPAPASQPEQPRKLAMAPTILNSPAPPPTATDAPATGSSPSVVVEPPAAGAPSAEAPQKSAVVPPIVTSKLRWPVQGKVLSGFGPRADGTHNDGVNVSVPMGTEVHVADEGTIAYAGSELKGYGNLVLVRHDNGWVTAYAHTEEILVKRGDRVKRGQVIARAGKSGQVDQPQLHFELRQGSKPVDPTPFMENL